LLEDENAASEETDVAPEETNEKDVKKEEVAVKEKPKIYDNQIEGKGYSYMDVVVRLDETFPDCGLYQELNGDCPICCIGGACTEDELIC